MSQVISLLVGVVSLATMVFAWWLKNTSDKEVKRKETDAEIDAANTARDWVRLFHKLRDK